MPLTLLGHTEVAQGHLTVRIIILTQDYKALNPLRAHSKDKKEIMKKRAQQKR